VKTKAEIETEYLRARSHAWIKYLKACMPAQVEYSAEIAEAKVEYEKALEAIGEKETPNEKAHTEENMEHTPKHG